ncbi:putative mitochondrial protein [Vitis vinifera]|uniref:Putative mitochondrial protein n=1 Tax=Vitis vinifera TaxID=29760 RepID=A0A438JBH5_VITVI|nr:putative mitochondrial protein [Vitis vinifera]
MLYVSNKYTTIPQPSPSNPIIIDSSKISPTTSESHFVQITTIHLNGDNFLRWSQSVRMYIKERGKMGYLTSEKKALVVDDLNYAIWDAENSMIFELALKLGEIRQGEDNVTKYFNSLKWIWQDLDLFNTYEWKFAEDHGRQSDLQVFEVRREESRKNVMLGKKGPGVSIEGSALVTTGGGYNKAATFQHKSDERPRVWKTGGKPGRAIIPIANEAETNPFTTKQMEHPLALLKSNSTSASDHMTNSSNMFESYSPCPGNKKITIVDGNPFSVPTPIHASSSSVTDISLPSHFDPSLEIFAPEPSLGLAPVVPAQDLDLDISIVLRKQTQSCIKHPIAKYISYSNLFDNYRVFTTNISKLVVPRNIQEALDEPSWKLAVFEEMNALKKNGTWEVVDLPREKKVVGCKWVFTIKSKADGSVERYKARLMAKGFTQTYGIDYHETFTP